LLDQLGELLISPSVLLMLAGTCVLGAIACLIRSSKMPRSNGMVHLLMSVIVLSWIWFGFVGGLMWWAY